MEDFERESCIRGFHVYKTIWEPALGEELQCLREHGNARDRYAVAVKRRDVVVGHLPQRISRLCSLFLRRGGGIQCRVTGRRRYSGDLLQGGLEIPCLLIFRHNDKEITKFKKLITKLF